MKPGNGSTNCPLWQASRPDRSPDHDRPWLAAGKLIVVTCSLCAKRPAKRACPALGRDICPTCCATKRLVEIRCPADCAYLDAAQKHPAAVVRRQQEHDLAIVIGALGQRPSEMQLQLFFLLGALIRGHRPDGLTSLSDADVADAAAAMAATLEAASRGVIAELAAGNPVSEGLRRKIDGFLAEVGKGGGSRFGRDAAAVLRAVERGARHEAPGVGQDAKAYLTLLGRILPPAPEPEPAKPASSLIIP
jgi:hypothetical protein